MARLGGFIGGLAVVYAAGSMGPEWLFWLMLALFIYGFWQLVKEHRAVDKTVQKFSIWKNIRETHISRMDLNWNQIPGSSPSSDYTDHPFARDLNIIGEHSLLQLMNTANYQGGTDKLAEYLLNREPDIKDVEKRSAIVKELVSKSEFRDRLNLRAELYKKQELENDWSLKELQKHLNASEEVNYRGTLLLLGSLALLNIILGGLYLAGILDPYVIFTLIVYLVIYNFNSEKISALYTESHQIEKLLTEFNAVLQFLESYNYQENSALKKFCKPFWKEDFSPSKYIKRIIRIASAASSQQSEVIWVLINFLVPWDVYFAQKLSSYKKELAPKLENWINEFYELEAFSSMANFGWINPQYNFGKIDPENDIPYKANDLGHPLIPENQKVTNDVTINNIGEIMLITGSNMAGKSTFLRTTGINLALCYAGAPVNASDFSNIPFRIFSSINITDSLDEGLSHFYAEVKRLRKLLTLLNDDHKMPVFFLVDEIYRGTNNRERLQGSEAFLQEVAGKNGIGLVSTHDLELAQLEESIPQLSNWHFAETIEGGKMSFEYKLKPGPCPTTNALKIMEMEGLPT